MLGGVVLVVWALRTGEGSGRERAVDSVSGRAAAPRFGATTAPGPSEIVAAETPAARKDAVPLETKAAVDAVTVTATSSPAVTRFPEIGQEFNVGGVPLEQLDLTQLSLDETQRLWGDLQRFGSLELAEVALTHREFTAGFSISAAEYRLLREPLDGRFFVRDGGWGSDADLREVTAVVPPRLAEIQSASLELLRNPAWRAEKERLLIETIADGGGFDPHSLASEPRRGGTALDILDPQGRVLATHVSSVVGWP